MTLPATRPAVTALSRARALVFGSVSALVAALLLASAPGAGARDAAAGRSREAPAPSSFTVLGDVDPTILHDIRYRTSHNFLGRPVTGYLEPLCLLTRPAAEALHRAQKAFLRRGYSIKVYDCFRPQRAVDDFVRWAGDLGDELTKAEFYPRVDKSSLFEDGYISERSGHSRGSTLDLTLVRLPAASQRPYVPGEPLTACYAPVGERFPDNTVDMGTGYDCFDTLAHTDDPRITGAAAENRRLLRSGLEAAGFTNYANEWWHYTLANEPFPDTYFDFPVARSSLTRR